MERIENLFSKIDNLTRELKSYIETLKKSNEDLCCEVDKASKAYFADIEIRKNNINNQIKALEMQKDVTFASIEGIRPLLMEATASGNVERIKELQSKMTELKANEAALDAQIEFLYTTPIPGNNELFEIAKGLNDTLEANGQGYHSICKKTSALAKEQVEIWQEIQKKTETTWYSPVVGFREKNDGKHSREFEKVAEYHCGKGECVERPQVANSNGDNTPYSVQSPSNTLIWGEPDYTEKSKVEGPRMD